MKKLPAFVFLAAMATVVTVRSQESGAPGAARIVGEIPDGTPPPPAPPKPEFIVPAADILDTTSHEQGGRTITIQRIKPIALPPPPAPAPPSVAGDESTFSERLAGLRAKYPGSQILSLGATVYRSKDSPSRTLVHYRPEGNGEPIAFWSSADFALIAGIHTFVATDGQTRSLFLTWSIEDIDRKADWLASHGRAYEAPDIPDFPGGPATFTIVGNQPAAETLVPIQSVHDLYNSEYARLKTAYEGREQVRIEQEAYVKANPPQPKNITLNYWRTEKPAPTKGGAQ